MLQVFPRDLFNQSNLLFGLARLSLWINDYSPEGWSIDDYLEEPIEVGYDSDSYGLTAWNVNIRYKDERLVFTQPYNSRDRCDLRWLHEDAEEYVRVLTEDGEVNPGFVEFVQQIINGENL